MSEIKRLQQVDLLYALFLGRMPESNFVRHDNLGRPMLTLVRAMIESNEFQQSIVERFLRYAKLPHEMLSLRLLPDVLALVSDAELAPPPEGHTAVGWESTLGRVLAAAPCRPIMEELYSTNGRRLISRLISSVAEDDAEPVEEEHSVTADIASGVEIIADTICRGWVLDRRHLSDPLYVRVAVNGAFARFLIADEFRRDVQDQYGGDGRAGFTLRIDHLPGTHDLARVTVELTEAVTGTVILPAHVIELSIAAGLTIATQIQEHLAQLQEYLGNVTHAPFDDRAVPRLPRSKFPFSGLRRPLPTSEKDIGALREDIASLRGVVDDIARDLPRLQDKFGWAVSRFDAVRQAVKLVLPPPKLEMAATFTIIIVADCASTDAIEAAAQSAAAQTLKATEIFLVTAAEMPAEEPPPAGMIQIVRYGPDITSLEIVNEIALRAAGSHLVITDAGTKLVPEASGWFAAAIDKTRASVLYADEEQQTQEKAGQPTFRPAFRPAFDYDLLLQRNYIGNTFCVGREKFNWLLGFSRDPTIDARYDFLLRVFETDGGRFRREVQHLQPAGATNDF